jgi:hypothetical protein
VLRTTEVDEHHGVVRFGFEVVDVDGSILLEGLDVAFLSADGSTIRKIIGFFGSLPGNGTAALSAVATV